MLGLSSSDLCLRYGSHPIYLEHRFETTTNSAQTHGVFRYHAFRCRNMARLPHSAAGGDNLHPPELQQLPIGGVLNFYFLSGPTPKSAIEQRASGPPDLAAGLGFWFPYLPVSYTIHLSN